MPNALLIKKIRIKKLTNKNHTNHEEINEINLQYAFSSWSMEEYRCSTCQAYYEMDDD